MKKLIIFLCSMLVLNFAFPQITLDRVVKKAEKKAEQRVERKIDKTIDKGLDKVEDGIDNSAKQKDNSKPKNEKTTNTKESKSENSEIETQAPPTNQEKPTLTWAKYDFVPGTEIIFEDNQEGEQNGEFPSKWDLVSGQIENANFDGDNVILFRKCNINGIDGIVPLMKNTKQDYLPEEFTIEFDAYFEKPSNSYRIYLLDTKNQKNIDPDNNVSKRFYLRFDQNSANGKDIQTSFYPGFSNANVNKSTSGWRHIAISFNKRALKAYIDDARVINVPNIGINPLGITLGFHNPSGNLNGFIKNVRIAKGAVPLYDKVLTDGKFVTIGIKFDVNKSTIKPESMGTINYVVKMMQDNPEIKFSVEGHTDSDGDDAANLKLSEARAKAILNKLVELGISKERLSSKGLGESKPVVANDTPENKAQNRRVEFVKF
jgi:OOP family OmpA-OmpF porin